MRLGGKWLRRVEDRQAGNGLDKGAGGLTAADLMPPPVAACELVGDNFISRSRATWKLY